MNPNRLPYATLRKSLQKRQLADAATRDHLAAYLEKQASAEHDEWRRLPNQMFWPPRVVNGVRNESLTIFFGSGISLAAGMPDWIGLLRQVGLDAEVERDPSASGDLLTLAELAAHAVGADALQSAIRDALREPRWLPTTAHYLLAALHLPIYVTTNYDTLFESAVEDLHGFQPEIITNDLNVVALLGETAAEWDRALAAASSRCYVLKLHGSISRLGEHLILTRSDYRRHYRSNPRMLELVRHVLGTRHTLFLGFSHRDPEVSRIIEDVIFAAEKTPGASIPGFYSLQFDMLQKTPEVFAARGIVALQPPLVLATGPGEDSRGVALAQGLADLLENVDGKLDDTLSLDGDLRRVAGVVERELERVLEAMKLHAPTALDVLTNGDEARAQALSDAILSGLADLAEFANQGVFVVNRFGQPLAASCGRGLEAEERKKKLGNVQERPYFRLAQSNRDAFVSDVFESMFNANATLAACLPLFNSDRFMGLVFLAFQLQEEGLLKRLREIHVPSGASLLVVDANGLMVLPPEKELVPRTPARQDLKLPSEEPSCNVGFPYEAMLQISRRDKRIDRLMQNVVPLAQDDDVHVLSSDIISYSVVTELKTARWKVALARYLRIYH